MALIYSPRTPFEARLIVIVPSPIHKRRFSKNSEKEEILNYLETTEEVDLTVRGLMARSQSVTSFVLSLLQAANVQRDFKKHWQGASNINSDHPPLQAEYEEGAFAFNNKKRRRKASELKKEERSND